MAQGARQGGAGPWGWRPRGLQEALPATLLSVPEPTPEEEHQRPAWDGQSEWDTQGTGGRWRGTRRGPHPRPASRGISNSAPPKPDATSPNRPLPLGKAHPAHGSRPKYLGAVTLSLSPESTAGSPFTVNTPGPAVPGAQRHPPLPPALSLSPPTGPNPSVRCRLPCLSHTWDGPPRPPASLPQPRPHRPPGCSWSPGPRSPPHSTVPHPTRHLPPGAQSWARIAATPR